MTATTPGNRKHTLRFRQRAENPPPMNVTEREFAVAAALDKYRVLTVDQIEVLEFFSPTRSRASRCKARLQKMFHNKIVARVLVDVMVARGRRPTIYSNDVEGAKLAAQRLNKDISKITWLTEDYRYKDTTHLDHDLLVNNFWVVVERLSREGMFELVNSITMFQFKYTSFKTKVPYIKQGAKIKKKEPDAYFALLLPGNTQPSHFFVEQDMGTKSKSYWYEKVKAYEHFRNSGLSEKYYGTKRFRILTKTTNTKRLENLMRWTKEAGGDAYFWFTTEDKIDIWRPNTFLDRIWQPVGREGLFSLNITKL